MIRACLDQSGCAASIGSGSQRLILEIVQGQEKAQTLDPPERKAAESPGYCKVIVAGNESHCMPDPGLWNLLQGASGSLSEAVCQVQEFPRGRAGEQRRAEGLCRRAVSLASWGWGLCEETG